MIESSGTPPRGITHQHIETLRPADNVCLQIRLLLILSYDPPSCLLLNKNSSGRLPCILEIVRLKVSLMFSKAYVDFRSKSKTRSVLTAGNWVSDKASRCQVPSTVKFARKTLCENGIRTGDCFNVRKI